MMSQVTSYEFTDNSDLFITELEKRARVALEAVGIQAEGHCKQELENTPKRIDTGLLRNSITHAVGGQPPKISSYSSNSTHGHTDSTVRRGTAGTPVSPVETGHYTGVAPAEDKPVVYIGTNVQYAQYVEEGTSRMKPNHFIKNGIERNLNEYKAIIKKFMEAN